MQLNTFFDLCSGIGGGRLGLEQAGMKSIGYSDTSRLSVKTYNLMFSTEGEKNYGNLKKIKTETLPPFDVLIAGFPCQTFSVIGRREGFDDIRGQLIFHIAKILRETQPKAFILENVRGLVNHEKGKTLKTILELLDEAGFDVVYKVLTSLDYGVPQMRQRVYFIGVNKNVNVNIGDFQWPDHKPIPPLSDYLIDESPIPDWMAEYMSFYLNNAENKGKYSMDDLCAMEGMVLDTRMSDLRIYDGKVPTLRSQRDGVLYVRGGKLFSLTGHEALLLQGFPREYADKVYNVVSDRHLLMQAGNAMTVNVIASLAEQLKCLFQTHQQQEIKKETKKMEKWELFEKECTEFLNASYSSKSGVVFQRVGGSVSNEPDIYVMRNHSRVFSIEVKMAKSQCGQFVLFPDTIHRRFVYSEDNEFGINEFSARIIIEMDKHFEEYTKASSNRLDLDEDLCYSWVKNHYKIERGSEFFISKYKKEYVLFGVDRFDAYFDISAKYRNKGSGSQPPSREDIKRIKNYFERNSIRYSKFDRIDKKVFVEIPEFSEKKIPISIDSSDFLFRRQDGVSFRITKLSKTNNPNVIFNVSLKRGQDPDDLKQFLDRIGYHR